MFNPNRTPRPRLSLPILGYAALDAFGMLVLAVGLAYLTRGPGVFFASFPTTTAEALVATIAGAGLMFWSGAQILRHIGEQQMGKPESTDPERKE